MEFLSGKLLVVEAGLNCNADATKISNLKEEEEKMVSKTIQKIVAIG
jgi:hypothetical protein